MGKNPFHIFCVTCGDKTEQTKEYITDELKKILEGDPSKDMADKIALFLLSMPGGDERLCPSVVIPAIKAAGELSDEQLDAALVRLNRLAPTYAKELLSPCPERARQAG